MSNHIFKSIRHEALGCTEEWHHQGDDILVPRFVVDGGMVITWVHNNTKHPMGGYIFPTLEDGQDVEVSQDMYDVINRAAQASLFAEENLDGDEVGDCIEAYLAGEEHLARWLQAYSNEQ